jgi:hypothetical protein
MCEKIIGELFFFKFILKYSGIRKAHRVGNKLNKNNEKFKETF